jgi:hypothetical protein
VRVEQKISRPLDPEVLATEAARHGIEILAPPGTLPEG